MQFSITHKAWLLIITVYMIQYIDLSDWIAYNDDII